MCRWWHSLSRTRRAGEIRLRPWRTRGTSARPSSGLVDASSPRQAHIGDTCIYRSSLPCVAATGDLIVPRGIEPLLIGYSWHLFDGATGHSSLASRRWRPRSFCPHVRDEVGDHRLQRVTDFRSEIVERCHGIHLVTERAIGNPHGLAPVPFKVDTRLGQMLPDNGGHLPQGRRKAVDVVRPAS